MVTKSKVKRVGRQQIAVKMLSRLGGAVDKKDIYGAISIICNEISTAMIENRAVSIKNFGTFSPYLHPGRLSHDVHLGKLAQQKPFRRFKFYPHHNFIRLLKDRRANFLKR